MAFGGQGGGAPWGGAGAASGGGSSGGSSSGAAAVTTYAPVPPFNHFHVDAQDLDLTGNSTLADGGAVATAINKGSYVNSGARVDFTKAAGNIFFQKLFAEGRLNNLSCIRSDGTGRLQTPAFPATGTVYSMVTAIYLDDLSGTTAAHNGVADGLGASRGGFYIDAPSGSLLIVGAGGAGTDSGLVLASQAWSLVSVVFNGANSFARVNGVQGPNVNPTPVALTGLTLLSLIGGAFPSTMRMAEFFFVGDATSYVNLEGYLTAKLGAFPQ